MKSVYASVSLYEMFQVLVNLNHLTQPSNELSCLISYYSLGCYLEQRGLLSVQLDEEKLFFFFFCWLLVTSPELYFSLCSELLNLLASFSL